MIGRKSRQHNPSGVQSQALPDLCRPREEGRQKPYVAVLLSASEEKLIRELERRRVGDVECPFRFLALETTEVVEMSGLLGICLTERHARLHCSRPLDFFTLYTSPMSNVLTVMSPGSSCSDSKEGTVMLGQLRTTHQRKQPGIHGIGFSGTAAHCEGRRNCMGFKYDPNPSLGRLESPHLEIFLRNCGEELDVKLDLSTCKKPTELSYLPGPGRLAVSTRQLNVRSNKTIAGGSILGGQPSRGLPGGMGFIALRSLKPPTWSNVLLFRGRVS